MRNYFVVLINSAKIMRLKVEYIDYEEKKSGICSETT